MAGSCHRSEPPPLCVLEASHVLNWGLLGEMVLGEILERFESAISPGLPPDMSNI